MNEVLRYDELCRSIAECARLDEGKQLHDRALALTLYAKQAKNKELEKQAKEVRMRAERRLGELLLTLPRSPLAKGGDAKSARRHDEPISPYAQALVDNDIPTALASRWQRLARVAAGAFEAGLATDNPSTNALIGVRSKRHRRTRMTKIDKQRLADTNAAVAAGGTCLLMYARLLMRAIEEQKEFSSEERSMLDRLKTALAATIEGTT